MNVDIGRSYLKSQGHDGPAKGHGPVFGLQGSREREGEQDQPKREVPDNGISGISVRYVSTMIHSAVTLLKGRCLFNVQRLQM